MQSLHIQETSDTDQRIDKFLKKYLPNAPLGGIYKWLRTGKIKVNKKKVEQTYRIEDGDIIDIHLSDTEIETMRHEETKDIPVRPTALSIDILYEDDTLMIVNKPYGINVHPGDHKSQEVSVIEIIQDRLGGAYDTLSFKPSLVHRIDRDTSGVLLIAKEKKALESLLRQLQSGKIEKVYHTITHGIPEKKRDTLRYKLLRKENAKNEAKVIVSDLGQTAITHYQVLREIRESGYSLIECRIETGRTHQIRVHLSTLGHPIIGDKAYGDLRVNSVAKKVFGIGRQLLHAESLSFLHPKTQKQITIHAPYPEDFQKILLEKEK